MLPLKKRPLYWCNPFQRSSSFWTPGINRSMCILHIESSHLELLIPIQTVLHLASNEVTVPWNQQNNVIWKHALLFCFRHQNEILKWVISSCHTDFSVSVSVSLFLPPHDWYSVFRPVMLLKPQTNGAWLLSLEISSDTFQGKQKPSHSLPSWTRPVELCSSLVFLFLSKHKVKLSFRSLSIWQFCEVNSSWLHQRFPLRHWFYVEVEGELKVFG